MSSDTVQEAYNKFDFEAFAMKVHPIFVLNKWKWGIVETEDSIPSVLDIYACLRTIAWECLRTVEKNNMTHCDVSTGRLQVRLAKYDDRWCEFLELIPEYSMV